MWNHVEATIAHGVEGRIGHVVGRQVAGGSRLADALPIASDKAPGCRASPNSAGRLRSDWPMPVGTHDGHSNDTPTGDWLNLSSRYKVSESVTTPCLLTL